MSHRFKNEEDKFKQDLDYYIYQISSTLGPQKGKFDQHHQIFESLKEDLSVSLSYFVEYELRRVAAILFKDVVENLLSPLRKEVKNIKDIVERCFANSKNDDKDRYDFGLTIK